MALSAARLAFQFILRPCGADRLPLEVLDRIGSAAGEGYDVIPDVAGACSGRQARRRAGMSFLELARHCTRSMLTRQSNAKGFQPNQASEHDLAPGRHQLSTVLSGENEHDGEQRGDHH